MIIDVVGMRGAGKSTFTRLMKEEHNVFTREDKDKFQLPTWKEFCAMRGDIAGAHAVLTTNHYHWERGDQLTSKQIRRQKRELCLWMALASGQLGERIFVWDKGLLEIITYLQLHGRHTIDYKYLDRWPKNTTVLITSKKALDRSRERPRREQWSRATYYRMSERHKLLMGLIPHRVIRNDGTIEDLRNEVQSFFDH